MKRLLTNTYLWGFILFFVGISMLDAQKASSGLVMVLGFVLLVVSVIRSIYRLIMRLFKKPVSPAPVSVPAEQVPAPAKPIEDTVENAANLEPQTDSLTPPEIRTVDVPQRAPQPTNVRNIHNIERFHKLENNVFSRKARKKGFVVFDLETTGLKAYDRICEIAAIKYDNQFHPLEGFETLVNPERAIAPEASAKSGIYDDMVSDSPTIDQVLPVFFSFVEGYPLIGYNAERFDIRYLNNAVNRCGMNCAIEYADALPWARNHYNLSSYKLGDVAESIGVSTANAHRAMGDCKMLGAIVRDMMIQ